MARARLLPRLGRLLDPAPAVAATHRFAAHLDREFPAVLAFLWAPIVPKISSGKFSFQV